MQNSLTKEQVEKIESELKVILQGVLQDTWVKFNLGSYLNFRRESDESYCADSLIQVLNEIKTHLSRIASKNTTEFQEKLNFIIQGAWKIPFCAFDLLVKKLKEGDVSLLLQLPHRSVEDETKLAYYRNVQDLLRSRETRTTPGRWFGANSLGSEVDGLKFNTDWCSSTLAKSPYFLLSGLVGGCSEENWKWAYANTVHETGSCMIKTPDAARVFSFDSDLDLYYKTEDDKPDGKIIARTILKKDKKEYVRLYTKNYLVTAQAELELKSIGYSRNKTLHGYTLGKIKPDNVIDDYDIYWLCYLDSDSDVGVLNLEDRWYVIDEEEDLTEEQATAVSSYRSYEGQNSKGYLIYGECKCKCKSKKSYEMKMGFSLLAGSDEIECHPVCCSCDKDYILHEVGYSAYYYNKKDFSVIRNYLSAQKDLDLGFESIVVRNNEVEERLKTLDIKEGFMFNNKKGSILISNTPSLKDIQGKDFHPFLNDFPNIFCWFSHISQNIINTNLKEGWNRSELFINGETSFDETSLYDTLYKMTEYVWSEGRMFTENGETFAIRELVKLGVLDRKALLDHEKQQEDLKVIPGGLLKIKQEENRWKVDLYAETNEKLDKSYFDYSMGAIEAVDTLVEKLANSDYIYHNAKVYPVFSVERVLGNSIKINENITIHKSKFGGIKTYNSINNTVKVQEVEKEQGDDSVWFCVKINEEYATTPTGRLKRFREFNAAKNYARRLCKYLIEQKDSETLTKTIDEGNIAF